MSRMQRGLHRLGIFLGAPFLLVAGALAIMEIQNPTGAPESNMPSGVLAYAPKSPDVIDETIIGEQQENGLVAPSGYVVLGMPVERPHNRFHEFIDEGIQTDGYTIFQLRDGREIILGTKDESKLISSAYEILRWEVMRGSFPLDTNQLAADVPVSAATWYSSSPRVQWPLAGSRPTFNFANSIFAIVAGLIVYAGLAGLGWVIRGFAK